MVDFIESLIQSNGILIAFIALLSGAIGAILKGRKDLEVKYDVDLKDKRIGYQDLLKNLKPLAEYSPSAFVTYDTLIKMPEDLKEWYYEMGGLFLTHSSR